MVGRRGHGKDFGRAMLSAENPKLGQLIVQCRPLAAEGGQAQQDAGIRVNDGHGWGGKLLSGHVVPAETPGPAVSRTGRDLIAAAAADRHRLPAGQPAPKQPR